MVCSNQSCQDTGQDQHRPSSRIRAFCFPLTATLSLQNVVTESEDLRFPQNLSHSAKGDFGNDVVYSSCDTDEKTEMTRLISKATGTRLAFPTPAPGVFSFIDRQKRGKEFYLP